MTRGQKIYFAAVCSLSVFLFMGVVIITMVIIPKGLGDPVFYRFSTVTMAVLAVGLIVTSVPMLKKKELLFIPMCLQCVLLFFTLYGIPIAIGGVLLLRAKSQREQQQTDAVNKILCPVCRTLPDKDAVQFGDVKVCSRCKDEFEQRLREGVE